MNELTTRKRILLLGGLLVAFGLLASGRMLQLQVLRHNYYQILANQEQLRKYQIRPNRGEIFIHNRGQIMPLVLNRNLKTLYADTNYVFDKAGTARQLAKVTGEAANRYEQAMASRSSYIVLKKQLRPELAAKIDKLQLSGIGLSEEPVRAYPEGALAAQVLGFVNNEGKGQYGVEEYLNRQLGGQTGLLNAKTDTRGIPIATSNNVISEPRDGDDLVLSIDRNIQARAEKVLKAALPKYLAESASAIVMDPHSGAILAMANYPTFNPGKFNQVNNYSVFGNRAAAGQYEPGSVFKIFSMATGLDNGAVSPQSTYYNSGSTRVADRLIKNALPGEFLGRKTMTEVMVYSLNSGVVEVLRRLGGGEITPAAKAKLYDYYTERFGFSKATGVEVPAEPGGTINPPSSDDPNYANMTFGQGLTASPLQLAAAVSALANGGTYYRPYLVDQVVSAAGEVSKTQPQAIRRQILKAETITKLKRMMELVVKRGEGSLTKFPGYTIGGKTGTAQLPDGSGGYSTTDTVGTFVSIVPLHKPHYVVLVRADKPRVGRFAGSSVAEPMAAEIIKWLLPYSGIGPGS